MPRYDMKCNLCGFETEITRSMNDTLPQKCLREDRTCDGIMEVQIRAAYLHPSATPTRKRNDRTSYRVR